MPPLLIKRAWALRDTVKSIIASAKLTHGTEVTYSRGGETLITDDAIIGQTMIESQGPDGFAVTVETRDYIFDRDTFLDDSGDPITPVIGDEIVEFYGSYTLTCRVISPAGNDPYKIDATRAMIRVHTEIFSEVKNESS